MQKRARDPSFSETSSPKRAASEDPSDQDTPSSIPSHPSVVESELVQGGSHLALADDSDSSEPRSSSTPNRPEDEQSSTLSYEEQLTLITNFKKQPLNVGDTWYLIDRRWYRRFETTLTATPPSPEAVEALKPIDNSRLASPDGKLKGKVTEGVDVELLPQTAWDALVKWFGKNVEIPRKVIAGAGAGTERVEFYVPHITVLSLHIPSNPSIGAPLVSKPVAPLSYDLSAATKYCFLKASASRSLKSSPATSRFWKLESAPPTEEGDEKPPSTVDADLLRKLEGTIVEEPATWKTETLESMNIGNGDVLVLEQRPTETSPWPTDPEAAQSAKPLFASGGYIETLEKSAKVTTSSASSVASSSGGGGFLSNIFTRSRTSGSPGPTGGRKGLVGLSNLGNTCFMNSALQCLANTTELNKYFLSGVFKEEINRQNPLGMKGQVADAFGVLITQLFLGSASSFSPGDFKRTIARFAPSFSGYQQHDSQELITFALDGLHEDLNRIRQKPYSESPDWMGGDDKDLAKMARICWDMYKKRNDSVIVDLFQGQYKSTLVCPDCGKEAITFDPFLYLTLPLPVKKKFQAKIYFVPAEPSRTRYEVELCVNKDASFGQVKNLLAGWFKVEADKLISAEVYNGTFYKYFANHDAFSEIGTGDTIVFYEVGTKLQWRDDGYVSADDDFAIVPVFSAIHQDGYKREPKIFGAPFFITVTADEARSSDAILDAVVQQYKRVLPRSNNEDYFDLGDDGIIDAPVYSPVVGTTDEIPASVIDAPDGVAEIRLNGDGPSHPILAAATDLNPPPRILSATSAVSDPVSDYPSPPSDGSPMDASPIPSLPSSTPRQAKAIFLAQTFTESFSGRATIAPQGRRTDNLKDLIPRSGHDWMGIPQYSTRSSLYGSDDETAATTPASSNGKEREKLLLVEPGKGIICVWVKDTADEMFGYPLDKEFLVGYERFVDPSLEAEQKVARGKKTVIDIEDCLQEFSKEETLGEDDLWYCSNCKAHRAATKKLEIWKVPDILVVHLKRFGGARNLRDKIDNLIEFPITDFNLEDRVLSRVVAKKLSAEGIDIEELGLEPFDEPLLYDLYAVDQHYGGLSGGHYTALAKNAEEDKWYSFDDSRVSALGNDLHAGIVTTAAYVLFYRRRTSRPIGGSSRLKAEQAEQAAREKAAASAPVETDSSPTTNSPSYSAPTSGRTSPTDASDDGIGRPSRTLSGLSSFMPKTFRSQPTTPSLGGSAALPALLADEDVDGDVEMGANDYKSFPVQTSGSGSEGEASEGAAAGGSSRSFSDAEEEREWTMKTGSPTEEHEVGVVGEADLGLAV